MDVLFSKCSNEDDLANLMTYLEVAKQYYKLKWKADFEKFFNRPSPDEWQLAIKKMEMDRIEALLMSKNEPRFETGLERLARVLIESGVSHDHPVIQMYAASR